MKVSSLLSILSPSVAAQADWHSTEPWVVYGMKVVAVLCFSLFFMSFLPVSGAVVTTGTVTIEGDYQAVQHLEGGIVSDRKSVV